MFSYMYENVIYVGKNTKISALLQGSGKHGHRGATGLRLVERLCRTAIGSRASGIDARTTPQGISPHRVLSPELPERFAAKWKHLASHKCRRSKQADRFIGSVKG